MKNSTRDQVESKVHKIKGEIKETGGQLLDNPKMEAEGTAEKIVGKVQEKTGQIKKVFGKQNDLIQYIVFQRVNFEKGTFP